MGEDADAEQAARAVDPARRRLRSITSATPRRRPRRTRSRASSRPTTSRATSSSRTSTSRPARRAAPRRSRELQFLLGARARSRRALQGAREPVPRRARARQGVVRGAGARVPRRGVATRSGCCSRSSGRRSSSPAPRRLTEELWQKAIIHPREDRHVGAIFSSTLGALAARHGAADHARSGSSPDGRADLDRDARAGRAHRQVRLRRARDRPGADGVAAGGGRWPARRQHGRPRRRAPEAGAVAAGRRAAARQERRARARVRGRQAAWRTCGPSGS